MSLRDPLVGSVMTPEEYSTQAMDAPLSFGSTFGGAAAEGFLQSPFLGTLIREAQTPELANTVVAGGRGGVQWREDTPDEVTDRGDVLYQTEDDFKASPNYREEIPFEKGMTASRSKALADQLDVSQTRQFFAQKRPVAAFLGGVAGAALDPINYIPVVGEFAQAAAVARVGRIAGTILTGAADAGLNTAIAAVATAHERAKFGDDVSWSAIMTNAAYAAMAGAVIGGVRGTVSKFRGLDAGKLKDKPSSQDNISPDSGLDAGHIRQATRLETAARRTKAAEVMNDALFGMVHDGEVKLGETSKAHIADMERAANPPIVEPAPIQFREIGPDTALTAMGHEVPVRYAVVEANDLVTSQLDAGGVNPQYPAVLQPRNRERVVSQMQIQTIAQNLDPRLLDKGPKASDGAPIIASSGVVESGNGRVLAIRQAYNSIPASAEKYKAHLAAQGYPVEGMKNPVLVRIRDNQMNSGDRQAFTRAANERDTLAMSGTERAMADASAMSDAVLSSYRGGEIDAAGNREFVKNFIRDIVSENDRGSLIGADGAMTQEATRRIEAALLAKAYKDADLVSSLIESTDVNIRSIGGALMDVAPSWGQMRAEVKDGSISPDVDLTSNLLQAAKLVQYARREGKDLALLIGQKDIFSGGSISPRTEAFLRLMFRETDNWKGAVGREKLSKSLQFYVDEARKTSSGVDMLGEKPVTPDQILDRARQLNIKDEAIAAGFNFSSKPENLIGKNFDEFYDGAIKHQATLEKSGQDIASELGLEFVNPGIKAKARAEAKLERKGYTSLAQMTDVVRGGFKVDTAKQADDVAAAISKQYDTIDEGWVRSAAGYVDRKVLVRFSDGTVGEYQIFNREMLARKEGKGHDLYVKWNDAKTGTPEEKALANEMQALYSDALPSDIKALASAGKSGKSRNNSWKRASDLTTAPESSTSAGSAFSQSSPGDLMNQAALGASDSSAGLRSQLINESDINSSPMFDELKFFIENSKPISERAPIPDGPVTISKTNADGVKTLSVGNQVVAHAKVYESSSNVQIGMLVTDNMVQRKGYAKALVNDLIKEFPNKTIDTSLQTDKGRAFFSGAFDETTGTLKPKNELPNTSIIGNRAPDFSGPAKEPPLSGLDVALKKVENNHKPAPSDSVPQAIADAKEEGFNPVTNENDLELDIQAMRNEGLLTPEDEAALAAADETHGAATAWEDVMTVAKSCFIRE